MLEIANHQKLEKCDITVRVNGGGKMGQTDAVRIAIAKAIHKFLGTKTIERIFRDHNGSFPEGGDMFIEPEKRKPASKEGETSY